MTADQVASILEAATMTYADEDELQAAIFDALTAAGVECSREVRLPGLGRIDLVAGRVGVEVKVAGNATAATRQLMRYAHCADIEELVLVTTKASHRRVPRDVGKPVRVVCLINGGIL